MTILFAAVTIIGIVETIALVAISIAMSRSDRESERDMVSFRLMGQAVGLLAAGLGGLAMTVGNAGALGFSVVAIASWIMVMVLMYMVVLPVTRKRWPAGERPD